MAPPMETSIWTQGFGAFLTSPPKLARSSQSVENRKTACNQTEPRLNPRVLFVAAEAVPLAKTGGLGDAVSGLASALRNRGVDVTVLMPAYPQAVASARGLRQMGEIPAPPGCKTPSRLLCGRFPDSDVTVALVDNESLFDRAGGPYVDASGRDFADNALRFAALSHAAAHIAAGGTALEVPHVVHAHDWHAGLTPLLMRERAVKVPSVQTIHNLAFQGVFPMEQADELGVPATARGADGVEFWGQVSYLKAGILFADYVTTVSHSYAREILTPRFGHGLDGLLVSRRDRLSAIPNGIDAQAWNPASDASLPKTYSASKRQGKAVCKRSLQTAFGLAIDARAPLLVHGSRLTSQKMAEVALEALAVLLSENAQLQVAVLGCGEAAIEQGMRALAARYPGRVGVHIGYEEDLAHLLHAGGDMLLHGSRFEPFGLTPVYGMRYGTVPIASRVGGMIDTVRDMGLNGTPVSGATGFLFDGETVSDMAGAIRRAVAVYEQEAVWQVLSCNGMRGEFSWDASGSEYVQMYASLTTGAVSRAFAQTEEAVSQAAAAMHPSAVAAALAVEVTAGVTAGVTPAVTAPRERTRKPRRTPATAGNELFSNMKLA